MPEPTPEQLRRQLIRLVHGRVDVLCAQALVQDLLELPEDDMGYRAWGLLTGMVVSYARPFTDSAAYGKLESKWSRFPHRPELKLRHQRLIDHRNTLLGHNDLSPHRGVVGFSSGGILRVPMTTEARSPIQHDGIRNANELFEFQEKRMIEAVVDLSQRLEALEAWPPGEQIEITLSDV